jgi:hypothetical protein
VAAEARRPRGRTAGGRRAAALYAAREKQKEVGVACSPHEEELAGVLGDGEAAAGEIDAGGPRWATTAASSVEEE